MKILLSGACGFVGATLARSFVEAGHQVFGFDNFIRPGSESNRAELKRIGVTLFHADIRAASDIDALPTADWVIDAAANPSVLAGVDGKTSSRQLIEHNLGGTINLLEYSKRHRAGFTLLSTSRVYSIAPLTALDVEVVDHAFRPSVTAQTKVAGLSAMGLDETFATTAPISLYGSTKLASEILALEYGETFDFPVFINRCGVLAGAGQFGRADQGIFAYWINSYRARRPLRYMGFGGHGHQVRDCLHPRDLIPLLEKQFARPKVLSEYRVINVGGGLNSAFSLYQLSAWCESRFGAHTVTADPLPRAFDIPWIVLDSGKASRVWDWQPQTPVLKVLDEIATHADNHPEWLSLSEPL